METSLFLTSFKQSSISVKLLDDSRQNLLISRKTTVSRQRANWNNNNNNAAINLIKTNIPEIFNHPGKNCSCGFISITNLENGHTSYFLSHLTSNVSPPKELKLKFSSVLVTPIQMQRQNAACTDEKKFIL